MLRKSILPLMGALAIGPVAAGVASAASSAGPAVKVEVKSTSKTLIAPTSVHGETGSITKGGTPAGKCPGASAAGALDATTHGRWVGKYYSSVGGIFITSILGVKPSSKSQYWSISVNGKTSSLGACAIKLKAGEKLLFKIV